MKHFLADFPHCTIMLMGKVYRNSVNQNLNVLFTWEGKRERKWERQRESEKRV